MSHFDRADWQRRGIVASAEADNRLPRGMAAAVIVLLSALCWAVLISIGIGLSAFL